MQSCNRVNHILFNFFIVVVAFESLKSPVSSFKSIFFWFWHDKRKRVSTISSTHDTAIVIEPRYHTFIFCHKSEHDSSLKNQQWGRPLGEERQKWRPSLG